MIKNIKIYQFLFLIIILITSMIRQGFAAIASVDETDWPYLTYSRSIKVFNAGIAGNNTKNLLDRLEKDCLSKHPDLVILMAGTNDVLNSHNSISLDDYKSNLNALVQKINKSGSKVLLLTLLPVYDPYIILRHPASFYGEIGPSGKRNQANDIIKDIAKQNKVYLLDLGAIFEKIGKIGLDRNSLIRNELNSNDKDGIHPTANGYRFIALAVYDFINSNNILTSSTVCFGDSITFGDGSSDKESYPAYLMKLLN